MRLLGSQRWFHFILVCVMYAQGSAPGGGPMELVASAGLGRFPFHQHSVQVELVP